VRSKKRPKWLADLMVGLATRAYVEVIFSYVESYVKLSTRCGWFEFSESNKLINNNIKCSLADAWLIYLYKIPSNNM